MSDQIIIFSKNKSDEYFRKSTEFASADVILKDEKATGSIERLSATILKGVQDQLFDIARQKKIEIASSELTAKYAQEYKESFIENAIKDLRKKDKSKTKEEAESEALKSYALKQKSIDRLAEKEAWREIIKKEVADDELIFKFDAKSIFDYAKVHGGGHKDRLYSDVQKIQQRFNKWSEKKFDVKSGKIVDKDVTGVLFPYSEYVHGPNSTIEIKLEKEMLQMVLFLNKNFLKYHLDSYIKVGTPNATRLYELLIDYISGNLFSSGRDLTFDYLQKKFNTNYKLFRLFLQRLLQPSLEKINNELGTNITWEADKKKGKAIQTIKFNISHEDQKILQGIRDEDLDDYILYSFEYYCTLLSLGGQKAQGGLKPLYEKVRGLISEGKFSFFGKTKEEISEEHLKNLEDAEELEALIAGDPNLAERFFYDPKYMNIIEMNETSFVAANAIQSLEYIKSSYLVPRGILSPALPLFESFEQEKVEVSKILPIIFKITDRKNIVIDEKNYDSMKATIELHLHTLNRFIFDSADHQKLFCEIFKIGHFDTFSPSLDAEIVEEERIDSGSSQVVNSVLLGNMQSLLVSVGNRSISKNPEKWEETIDDMVEEYGAQAVQNVIQFLSSGSNDAIFWLKNITTPTKFVAHFEKIEQVLTINYSALAAKVKNDPELQTFVELLRENGVSEEAIAEEVKKRVEDKIRSGKVKI